MTVYRIQVAKRGVITLPQDLRKQRDIQEGEVLTLLDLNGVFVLTQKERKRIALQIVWVTMAQPGGISGNNVEHFT